MTEGIVEFGILGPFEVVENGDPLDLGPHKQRSLLALLLINANRTVTTDRILEELWGDEASGKENALWVYISRIRSVLGEESGHPSALLTRDGGYSLAVDPSSVDFHRFETAAVSGRAALKDDPEDAAATLREALALWRGDALEDFRYDEFAQAEINRLEELRVTAIEDRIEADLRLGGSGELVGELDALIDGHPLRERPVSLKMLALYRAGRQADALRTFERFRRTLGEEMGLEPSPELARLEEQILLHDARLQTTMRSRITPAPTEYAQNPFKGLQPFQEADADHFFGRDRLVGEVIRRIADQRLVTLVGPSGSGKSSVVRAGVIPALRKEAIPGSGRWLIAQMVPGSRPFAELEAALLRSTIDAPDSLTDQLSGDEAGILRAALRVLPDDTTKILIVIDQFEELFTLVDDEETRTRFLDGLTDAINDPHGRVRVLLTLRADFYDRPLHYPTFGARMGDGVVNAVPMALDELEQAAEEPAARAGVSVSPSLLASLLTDVVGQPGALPLFQYTLTELFDRRAGGTLDLETYEAMGGLRGTLTRRADDLFTKLSEQQRAAGRQLFLRLVTIADTDEWSRRRVPASEIIGLDVDVVDLKAVIDAYGGARLLTFDRDQVSGSPTVEVAHEALLTEWERLRAWIDEARDDLRIQARLAAAGAEWSASGDNPDYLLTGSRLKEYEAWAALTTLSLTIGERAYLDASVAEWEAIATVEEERIGREVAMGRRAKRRLWGLAAAIVLMAGAGLFFVVSALLPEGPSVVLFTLADDESTFDEAMKIGLARAAAEYSIEERVVEFSVDPVEELRTLSEESPDLVLMDSLMGAALDEVAPDFPDVSYMLIDAELPDLLARPNVSMSAIREGGGSYLMGVAAAGKTTTGKVGFVSVQLPGFDDWIAGFVAGVEDTDPTVDVLVKWIGTTETAESGADFSGYAFGRAAPEAKVLANELIAEGADVIFHVAGVSGRIGVTAAVVEQSGASSVPLWVIGVDADQFAGALEAERAVLLTSMIKRTDVEVFDAIRTFVEGRFTPGLTELGITTGHVGFSPLGEGIAELVPQLEAARDAFIAGSIVVPDFVQPIPGWPSPDVTIEVVSDGDACRTAGAEPIVTMGDTVTFHIRNDSELAPVHFANVDETGLTTAEITDDFGWLDRVQTQGGRLTFPGGTTQVHARATRSQMILSCFDRASGTVLEPLIIPVAQP